MPTPQPGQSYDEFMEECIPQVLADGTADDEDQAVAICSSLWEQSRGRCVMPEKEQRERERRVFPLREMRLSDEGEPPLMSGYAAVFSQLSVDLGGFREIIQPGFFDNVLEDDVRALWNHDVNWVMGRTRAGTLWLRQDDLGLAIEDDLPDTGWARDAMVTMRRGDVDQMSFSFWVREGGDRWEVRPDGTVIRTLLAGGCEQLFDVAPVTFPAYPATSVGVRAQARALVDRQQQAGGGQEPTPADDGGQEVQAHLDLLRRRLELAGM